MYMHFLRYYIEFSFIAYYNEYEFNKMSFNEQLTKLRKRKNMTQIELANKMCVKQYVISSWETGRSEPSINQLCKLGDIFEISTDYLLDKPIVIANNESDFNKVIENVKMDADDDFLGEVSKLCSDLNNEKKKKMLDIIKASIDFNK